MARQHYARAAKNGMFAVSSRCGGVRESILRSHLFLSAHFPCPFLPAPPQKGAQTAPRARRLQAVTGTPRRLNFRLNCAAGGSITVQSPTWPCYGALMTNESPQLPDDESRRLQAEIDRIRSGLKWLRADQTKHDLSQDADDPEEDGASEVEDLRSLTQRMQSIVDRALVHAERFERIMGGTPEKSVATFAEVQEMLAATLAKGRAKGPAKGPAMRRTRRKS
jgi:hypothetical protein